jgi:ABC-type lipoprotein release transport system permease subunit
MPGDRRAMSLMIDFEFAPAPVLVVAAIVASLTPAARASRVDVVRALRAE